MILNSTINTRRMPFWSIVQRFKIFLMFCGVAVLRNQIKRREALIYALSAAHDIMVSYIQFCLLSHIYGCSKTGLVSFDKSICITIVPSRSCLSCVDRAHCLCCNAWGDTVPRAWEPSNSAKFIQRFPSVWKTCAIRIIPRLHSIKAFEAASILLLWKYSELSGTVKWHMKIST